MEDKDKKNAEHPKVPTDASFMTNGQKWANVKFNPSDDKDVDKIKSLMAEVIDIVEARKKSNESYIGNSKFGEAFRLLWLGQMAAVGAITNPY